MTRAVVAVPLEPLAQQALQAQFHHVEFCWCDGIEVAMEFAEQADILLAYAGDVTEARLERFANVRWIQVMSAGVDNMPLHVLEQRGIRLTTVRGIHVVPMAEYALAVMLQSSRRLLDFYQLQQQARWDAELPMEELAGKTALIVGAGAIGSGIAKRVQAMDMQVWGINSTGASLDSFDKMGTLRELRSFVSAADYVIVTIPLTPHTRGLIDANILAAMKPTALLINMARGAVVDEQALLQTLQERQIAGAVLDVFEQEPLPSTHPLWHLDNVRITPHVSDQSPHDRKRALAIFQHNLLVYQTGEGMMRNVVDLVRGY